MNSFLYLLLLPFGLFEIASAADKANYYELYDDLFVQDLTDSDRRNYKKQIRPTSDDEDALIVYLEFHLLALVNVDEKSQVMQTNVRLSVDWSDEILSWNETDYGNISSMAVPQELVWLPDIIVANSVVKQVNLGFDELPVRLLSSGNVVWEPTIIITTSCSIDVTYYPFDSQKCSIVFQTAISTNEEVQIFIDKTDPINFEDFSIDGSWEMTDSKAENLSEEDSKSKIQFSLLLTRRTKFFIVNIILPVLFLSLTANLVFALPADSGEKMGTGITVLLAYAVYLTIVTDHLPDTSLQVSFLAIYLTMLLGITAISVVTAVFVLRIHHRDEIHKVGRKTTKMTLILRWITCSSHPGDRQRLRDKKVSPEINQPQVLSETDKAVNKDKKPLQKDWSIYGVDTQGVRNGSENKEKVPKSTKSTEETEAEEYRVTWPEVAAALDKFFFIVFTTLTVLTTLIFMLILIIGSSVNKAEI